jgi:AcrR family transcriptional regulator
VPKIVDHEKRRWELVRAVWAVVRERGVQGASVRAVARQAGWSPSSVQYYFSTQSELLRFALRAMSEAAELRLAAPNESTEPLDRARTTLERLLPMDPDAQVATEIWVAFLSLVLIDAEAKALGTADHLGIARVCRQVIDDLSAGGTLAPGVDPDLEAARLHAVFDGLALHATTYPEGMTPTRIRQVLTYHLDRLCQDRSPAGSHRVS